MVCFSCKLDGWYSVEQMNAPDDVHRSTPFMYAMTVFHKPHEVEKLIEMGGDVIVL